MIDMGKEIVEKNGRIFSFLLLGLAF